MALRCCPAMTFSIVARCDATGRFGVASTTGSICVGARCPWVRAGVGAVATQHFTDPALGAAVLSTMETWGASASDALTAVLGSSPHRDHAAYRQLAVIDADGSTASWSGGCVGEPAGSAAGVDCVATGNLLAGADKVPGAMVSAFEATNGEGLHLAERLLRAIEAGEAAGGEQGQIHSAALVVTHDDVSAGWPLVDLRVDWHATDPLGQLRGIWERYAPQLEGYALRASNPAAQGPAPIDYAGSDTSALTFRGHSFLLYFDAATEAALAAAGTALDQIPGLGVVGQRYSYKPHISLAICSEVDLGSASAVLKGLAEKTAPFTLTLGAAATGGSGDGLFADANGLPSLMLLPTVTSELTTLHAAAHAQVCSTVLPLSVAESPVDMTYPHSGRPSFHSGLAESGTDGANSSLETPSWC
jgi:uncharacterized Ntn-hydrolase superfamily protein